MGENPPCSIKGRIPAVLPNKFEMHFIQLLTKILIIEYPLFKMVQKLVTAYN